MIKTTLEEMKTKKVSVEFTQLELMMAFLHTGVGISSDPDIEESLTEDEKQALYNLAEALEGFTDVIGDNETSDELVKQVSKKVLERMGLILLNSLTMRH